MNITNKFDLPASIYNKVNTNYERVEDRIWVTDLIGPPMVRRLSLKHWDDMEEDASERLYSLLGQATHHLFETNEPGICTELKLESKVKLPDGGDITVSGRLDYYNALTGTLDDFKITSVWSLILGDHPEYETQLNTLAWLLTNYMNPNSPASQLERAGMSDVKELRINMILRDWVRSKRWENDYPNIPFHTVDIPLWSYDKQQAYIEERVKIHTDSGILPCTDVECWAKPTTWAVMKKGGKRAVRVFNDTNDLQLYMEQSNLIGKESHYIQERPGEKTRCKGYCSVSAFCPNNPYRETGDILNG